MITIKIILTIYVQLPICIAILNQTGSCQTGHDGAAAIPGPVVAPYWVSQCAIARMATTGNFQSGARLAKISCEPNNMPYFIAFSFDKQAF